MEAISIDPPKAKVITANVRRPGLRNVLRKPIENPVLRIGSLLRSFSIPRFLSFPFGFSISCRPLFTDIRQPLKIGNVAASIGIRIAMAI